MAPKRKRKGLEEAKLACDEAKAAEEAAIRHRAAQSTQGLIRLNVGGVEYTTSLATLTAVPDSYFSALFGGDWEQIKTPDGAVFLDRDGEVFKYILQYLRAKRDSKPFNLPASVSPDTASAVADEAMFLGLPELQSASMRPTGEYEYDIRYYGEYSDVRDCLYRKDSPAVVHPGWELVSAHVGFTGSGNYNTLLVVCRRLIPLCDDDQAADSSDAD